MNIHPAFVHFPIAFLFLYAVLELIRCKCATDKLYWFYLKATLVIVGTGSMFVTMMTGEMAEELWKDTAGPMAGTVLAHPEKIDVIETHAMFAGITFLVFLLIAAAYANEWVKREDRIPSFARKPGIFASIWAWKIRYSQFVLNTPFVAPTLALIGLVLLTILGALGADIVYGADVDPLVGYVHEHFIH